MGIRHLNRYLQENGSSGIKKIHFNQLSGKRIAIDTSIYLYRFKSENALIENMYLMVSLFKHFNIVPIFVFDGPFPKEKQSIINERRKQKEFARTSYNTLKEQLNDGDNNSKMEICLEMDRLKKSFVTIRKNDIKEVKELFDVYGVNYITAPGEADQLCAKMVQKKIVWGCLSEDMDMFVYGCRRVLRYISIINCTMIYYDFKQILSEMKISLYDFKQICVLSGTDYNNSEYNLFQSIKFYTKYKKSSETNFYEWLLKKKYCTHIDDLYNIIEIFNLNNIKVIENINLKSKKFDRNELHAFMKKQGFIYL